ncbi:DUF2501 domain-containing protein [Lampropedia aestuarii]|uniref:DUF2501 domain-containing protein n=1 Tax=Lampropedia aestuarii TaxID=2562762 RepID=A0A4S5BY39_9BURK|nr:DUF2501 domain-containing protein [Lampropedia aestuarii]THJ36363.1 DUF2501 domain-containing protein [Lampropedia aestuarii]
MRSPFVRCLPACLVAGVLLGLVQLPVMAQNDPLGDLILQKTQPKAAPSQPAVAAETKAVTNTPAAPSAFGLPAAAPNTSANTPPGTAATGNAWGQAGSLGAAAAGVLNGGGVDAAALSSLGLPSLFGGSAGNVAGVLQYCVQNNYLNKAKEQVNALKGGLLSMAGLQNDPAPQASNSNYASGLAGILMGGEGERFDLNSIQANLKEKACSYVLEQAPSLL